MTTFEGSYLGQSERITPRTRMECGVCWWVYDPARGDETWQIRAGTAFSDLPEHWRCPACDNPAGQFMALEDTPPNGGRRRPAAAAGTVALEHLSGALAEAYRDACGRMQALPVYNPKLAVAVLPGRRCAQGTVTVACTPWCMNLVLVPPPASRAPIEGSTRQVQFPSGEYLFVASQLPPIGTIESCSLFSPMEQFQDPAVVHQVAQHALDGLFTIPEQATAPELSRRGFLRGGREQVRRE